RRTPRHPRKGCRTGHRARGDLRTRRCRYAHGDGHPQRAITPRVGARPVCRRAGTRGGESRPQRPIACCRPVLGSVTLTVAEGDSVVAAQPIATIEAMKMEAAITAPRAGTVTRLAVNTVQQVEGGDLLAVISVGDTTNVST